MYSDLLKDKLTKFFRSFGFSQERMDISICELVLKKDYFYIFVRYFDEKVSSKHLDEIDIILRNLEGGIQKHICIIIADNIEEDLEEKMDACDIVRLKTNEIFVDEILRNNFYSLII